MKAKFIYEVMGDVLKGKSEEEIMSSLENTNLDPNKLLLKSSMAGFLPGAKKALEIGADVNAYNNAALQWASGNGYLDIVEFLLKNGADVHAKDDLALRVASHNGHLDVVELLKKYM